MLVIGVTEDYKKMIKKKLNSWCVMHYTSPPETHFHNIKIIVQNPNFLGKLELVKLYVGFCTLSLICC
jgi:hypothetical protein